MKIIITSLTMYDDRLDDDKCPMSAIIPVPKEIKDTPKFLGYWLSVLPVDLKNKMKRFRRIFIADDSVTRERIDHFLLFGEEDNRIREGDAGKFEEVNVNELLIHYDAKEYAADKFKRMAKQEVTDALKRGDSKIKDNIQIMQRDMIENPDWFTLDSGLVIPN